MTPNLVTKVPASRRPRGLVIIIAYKLGKGALWLVLASILSALTHMGFSERLLGFAEHLRHHSRAWSLELAELTVRVANRHYLWTIIVALLVDGVASVLEGWALLCGHGWGPWLVVTTTGSLLPFEIRALARKADVVRALLLTVNTAIVVYLARRAMREHRLSKHRVTDK